MSDVAALPSANEEACSLGGDGDGTMSKKAANGKLSRKIYDNELRKLQVELCSLQTWVRAHKQRIIILFEGRDAAGKGGTIKAIVDRVSPRVFRVVALPTPSDREHSQIYMQRYVEHFPSGGEIVIFDRSWYNRTGVEYVMGFCTHEQHQRFLALCPIIEKFIVEGGTRLIKIWLEVGQEEQERRFRARIDDPIRQWKLSPMDLESYRRWYDYSKARDLMFEHTDTEHAPWYVVDSNDKKQARLNCIAHILACIPYRHVAQKRVELPERSGARKYDDTASLIGRRFVEARY